jgi:hypothetical protein
MSDCQSILLIGNSSGMNGFIAVLTAIETTDIVLTKGWFEFYINQLAGLPVNTKDDTRLALQCAVEVERDGSSPSVVLGSSEGGSLARCFIRGSLTGMF